MNLNSHGLQLRIVCSVVLLVIAMTPAWLIAQVSDQIPGEGENTEPSSACRVGMRVYESERGKLLLGEVIPEDIDRLLPGWSVERETYQPDTEDLAVLTAVPETVEIICVMGTWCGDSEREVPRFWKILQEADNSNLTLAHFAVGRASDEKARKLMVEIGFDESLRDVYNVELVPTFIFYRGDRELGRIIEPPVGTLEGDAAEILTAEFTSPGRPRTLKLR